MLLMFEILPQHATVSVSPQVEFHLEFSHDEAATFHSFPPLAFALYWHTVTPLLPTDRLKNRKSRKTLVRQAVLSSDSCSDYRCRLPVQDNVAYWKFQAGTYNWKGSLLRSGERCGGVFYEIAANSVVLVYTVSILSADTLYPLRCYGNYD